DTKPPVPGSCPATAADDCDENAAGTDSGTLPRLKVTDLAGNELGASLAPVAGQAILISAVESSVPGGCAGGAVKFQFSKNGAVVQDWSGKAFYEDTAVEYSPTYRVLVRCSSDTSCTSVIGATAKPAIYDGVNTDSDGGLQFGSDGVAWSGGGS